MYTKGNKCDCIILNLWSCTNYGASLTAYGVQCLVEKLGYDCKIVNYKPKIKLPYKETFAETFAKEYLKLTTPINNYDDLYELNNCANTFIVGSDQVWNFNIMRTHHYALSKNIYLLDFVKNFNKKISLAASFGLSDLSLLLPINKEYVDTYRYFIKQFDFVSVREDDGVNILNNEFNINSEQLIDGAFYIPKIQLENMIKEYKTEEKYIGCYVLPYYEKKKWYVDILKKISDKLNLPIKYLKFDNKIRVEEWLAFIKNSEFIITDSYHATVFSIIFNKPFLQVQNAATQSRFDSLYRLLGLHNKSFSQGEIFNENCISADINWEHINSVIEKEVQKSEIWLKKAIETPKESKQNDYDFINKMVSRLYMCEENTRVLTHLLNHKNKIYRRYYRYKILSQITFGKARQNYWKQKKEYEKLVKQIKKI